MKWHMRVSCVGVGVANHFAIDHRDQRLRACRPVEAAKAAEVKLGEILGYVVCGCQGICRRADTGTVRN